MNRQEFDKALAKGIKVFRCIRDIKGSGPVAEGELVELARDDGSNSPAFYFPNKEKRDDGFSEAWNYMYIAYLEPYIEEKGVEKGMDRKEFEEALAKGIRTFVCSGLYFDNEYVIKPGEIVELKHDDKTTAPQFYYPNREQRGYNSNDNWAYILLSHLEPYKPVSTRQYQDWADFVASEVSCFHELAGHDEYVEQLCATILNIGDYLGGDYEKIAQNLEMEFRKYDEEVCKTEEALPEYDYKVGEILRVTYDYANWFNIGDIVKVTAIEENGYIALESLMPVKFEGGKWSIPAQFVERV